jgi:hypothetical protein
MFQRQALPRTHWNDIAEGALELCPELAAREQARSVTKSATLTIAACAGRL